MIAQPYPLWAQVHGDHHDRIFLVIGWEQAGLVMAPVIAFYEEPGWGTEVLDADADRFTLTTRPPW